MRETGTETAPSEPALAAVRNRLEEVLRPLGRVVVALSGGVDSAALLAVASEILGTENVAAVTGLSPAVPIEEIDDARHIASRLSIRHEVLETHEIERPGYASNTGERCFHCRTELFELLTRYARDHGFRAVCYGAIVDDLDDHRPGMEAARRMGVRAPLLEAGVGKRHARALAAIAGLEVSEKPASACLASRIPTGTPVTPERLDQVARAERALHALGLRQLRVRHHGEIARIELDAYGLERLADPPLRAAAVGAVKAAGFRYVVVDLEGYRPASSGVDVLYSIRPIRDGGQ